MSRRGRGGENPGERSGDGRGREEGSSEEELARREQQGGGATRRDRKWDCTHDKSVEDWNSLARGVGAAVEDGRDVEDSPCPAHVVA